MGHISTGGRLPQAIPYTEEWGDGCLRHELETYQIRVLPSPTPMFLGWLSNETCVFPDLQGFFDICSISLIGNIETQGVTAPISCNWELVGRRDRNPAVGVRLNGCVGAEP